MKGYDAFLSKANRRGDTLEYEIRKTYKVVIRFVAIAEWLVLLCLDQRVLVSTQAFGTVGFVPDFITILVLHALFGQSPAANLGCFSVKSAQDWLSAGILGEHLTIVISSSRVY